MVKSLLEGNTVFLYERVTHIKPACPHSFARSDLDTPFARWSKEQVCDWLQEQGLGLYLNMAHVWISSGQTLLQGSQQDLEKVSTEQERLYLNETNLYE